ncbi:MAG: shikimate kinase [Fidelibacterota bacterium]
MNVGNIYLIGMMGSGKTTVGKLLADKLQTAFIDLDEMIETNTQKTVRDIFEQNGELHFRKLESETLVNVNQKNSVVACGGGIVLKKSNRSFMRLTGKVVFLNSSIDELVNRLKTAPDRPLLKGGQVKEKMNNIWIERKKYYKETAHITINVDGQTPKQITELIIKSGYVL